MKKKEKIFIVFITIMITILGIILCFMKKDARWFFIGLSLSQGYIIGKLLLAHLDWHKRLKTKEKLKKWIVQLERAGYISKEDSRYKLIQKLKREVEKLK